MSENLTLVFCVLAAIALVLGKAAQPPDLMHAFAAYQTAAGRGDMHRAARYGEAALVAARRSPLLDTAGIARLDLMVGETEERDGNKERARQLFELASQGLADGAHPGELATAKARLDALDRQIAERSLRGPVMAAPGG